MRGPGLEKYEPAFRDNDIDGEVLCRFMAEDLRELGIASIVPDEESRARVRQAAANIIARRKGVSLGGLSIKDLINKGRR